MYEDAQLICEGPCNPDVRDYDEMCEQIDIETARPVSKQSVIASYVRRLRHTTHIAVSNVIYRLGGWHREWQCGECGTKRIF